MRLRGLSFALLLALVSTRAAEACMPIPIPPIYFDDHAINIKAHEARQVERAMGFLQSVEPKCVKLKVGVVSDRTETSVENDRLGPARAVAVRRLLKDAGFQDSSIDIGVSVGNLDAPAAAKPLRWALINWSWAKGRYRCDPSITRKVSSCGYDTDSCYLELTDGTICNLYNVPDPNPQRYSVTPSGQRIE